jgi:hypothetical protein
MRRLKDTVSICRAALRWQCTRWLLSQVLYPMENRLDQKDRCAGNVKS